MKASREPSVWAGAHRHLAPDPATTRALRCHFGTTALGVSSARAQRRKMEIASQECRHFTVMEKHRYDPKAIVAWPDVEPADLRGATLWLVGTANENAMPSVNDYGDRLGGTRVVLEVMPELTHEDELTKVDVVLPSCNCGGCVLTINGYLATKAAPLPNRSSRRTSLRRRVDSSRSMPMRPLRPFVRSAWAFRTQSPSADAVRSSSRATSPTVFPSSRTRRTAPALNSSVNCRR